MALSISETFNDMRFLLDEARLRKVVELAAKRLNKAEPRCEINYEVARKDDSEYSTSDIDEVLSESNIGSTRLQGLTLRVIGKGHGLTLQFNIWRRTPVSLTIKGSDRDLVMLIGADLREYINNEIIVKPFWNRWLAIPLAFIWYYLFVFVVKLFRPLIVLDHVPSVSDVLKNPDLAAKLNYLIQRQTESGPSLLASVVAAVFICPIMGLLWLFIANPQWEVIVPGNIFLIGKERERYDRLISIRDKIVWGVIVTAAVSIVAGFIVWWLTKP